MSDSEKLLHELCMQSTMVANDRTECAVYDYLLLLSMLGIDIQGRGINGTMKRFITRMGRDIPSWEDATFWKANYK